MAHKVLDTLKECKDILKENNIRLYDSDAEFILAHVLDCNRGDLLTMDSISDEKYYLAIENTYRRVKHEPLDSIIGYTNFYSVVIPFSKDVLTPRNETEILVDKVVKDIKANYKAPKVLDLCSGSGCIGLAIAKSTSALVLLSDISGVALDISMKNAKINNVDVQYVKSDLFSNIQGKYDIIVSNPPYIRTKDLESLEAEVRDFDPVIALDGKDDGYYFYREIVKDLKNHLNPHGRIYFEVGYDQAQEVSNLLKTDFENISIIKDYSGIDRIVTATLKD